MKSFWRDGDQDGFGDKATTTTACDAPERYVDNAEDCDDQRADVNPDADEVCNIVDDNCDGKIDEGVALVCYPDTDNDGFAAAGAPQLMSCGRNCPGGTTRTAPTAMADCNDSNPALRPGALETCDNTDENCNGRIDESLTRPCGSPSLNPEANCRLGLEQCLNGAWVNCTGVAAVPDNQCDDADNNCNGVYDESTDDGCWAELTALNGTNGLESAALTVSCEGRKLDRAPGMLRCPRGSTVSVSCSVPTARVQARFNGQSCDSMTRSSCSLTAKAPAATSSASARQIVCDVLNR